MGQNDRMLSYLPLAHVVERVLVEHGWLRTGIRLYFAESLETFAADAASDRGLQPLWANGSRSVSWRGNNCGRLRKNGATLHGHRD